MTTPNPTLHLLGKKIFFSTLVQYVGKVFQIFIAGLTIKLISNFLSENDYGVYATITEYALFFSVVANLGIFANIIRKMSVNPSDGKTFVNSLYLRVVTALIFFAFGIVALLVTGQSALFVIGTSLFFGVLFLDFMTSVCDGMLQANYLMGRATVALIVGKLLTYMMLYGIIGYVGSSPEILQNVDGIILIFSALMLGSLTTFLLSFYFVARKIHLVWRIDRHFAWNIFRMGLPFGIINIINSLYFRFLPDYFSQLTLTDKEFATFSISFHIAQVMSLFSTFLMFSVLPGLREYIDQKHWVKVRKLYSRILLLLASGGVILVVFGSLFGPTILTLLTNERYFLPEFWYVLPLMLLLAAISYGYDLILITLFAFDKTKWLLSRECFALLFSLVFFIASLSIPDVHGKILAIILGAIVGEGTMVIAGLFKTRKILRATLG